MPAHRTSRRALRSSRRAGSMTGPSASTQERGCPAQSSPLPQPFGPFRAPPLLRCAALSDKPPAVEYPLPLAQPFCRFWPSDKGQCASAHAT